MLFLALPILACVGFTAVGVTAGSFVALWQSAFGTGPVFNTLLSAGMGGAHAVTVVSTSTSAIFGAMFYGIKTLIVPPPKRLEWWETDVFKNVVGLAVLLSTILLVVLRLRRYLHRKNRDGKGVHLCIHHRLGTFYWCLLPSNSPHPYHLSTILRRKNIWTSGFLNVTTNDIACNQPDV